MIKVFHDFGRSMLSERDGIGAYKMFPSKNRATKDQVELDGLPAAGSTR
jgi:hypothetical protein